MGTEQVERAVEEAFPSARIARMDVDTTAGKWAHHTILSRVERGEVDILLGTQMIAKGLDFANVTLVGVINADVGINLPDFRATERTFQLLTQVAGRAGRGPKGGEVFIQTALPNHYAIESALEHDFVGFAERELETRGVSVGTATVYRTLEVLVRSGLVVERDFAEGFKRYEPARGIPQHEHLLCTVCGRVREFRDERLERMTTVLAEQGGYVRQSHRLVIYGICEACRT